MDFRAALIEETKAFGDLYRDADPATPIPTCPGWTALQLFKHLGRGDRWCAQIISERRTKALDPRDVRDGRPPDGVADAIDWLNGGAQLVLDAVDQVGSDARVWTFNGPKPAGFPLNLAFTAFLGFQLATLPFPLFCISAGVNGMPPS